MITFKRKNSKVGAIKYCLFSTGLLVNMVFAQFTETSTSYTYTPEGQIATVDGPRVDVNDITTYRYDQTTYFLREIENALGHIQTFSNYNARGEAQTLTDANGVNTELSYHIRGWLETITVKDPSGNVALDAVTRYTYDAVGQVICMTSPEGVRTRFFYDDARRLTSTIEGASSCEDTATGNKQVYELDAAGNPLHERIYDASSADTLVYHLERRFDELSRLMELQEVDADGDGDKEITHYGYDANDFLTQVTDAENHVQARVPDALNRVKTTTDANQASTSLEYDAGGRLTKVIGPEQAKAGTATEYSYNFADMLTDLKSPETGHTKYVPDEAGNVVSMTDARGITTSYSFDALNRLLDVVFPDDDENISYSWDDTGLGLYHRGRLSRINYEYGRITYDYDHRGNVTQQEDRLNGKNLLTRYSYNLDGQVTDIIYPHGLKVSYEYNPLDGKLLKVRAEYAGQSIDLASEIAFMPFGPIKNLTYGNGYTRTLSYDQNYRLKSIKTPGLQELVYSHAPDSNISTLLDSLNLFYSNGYEYDPENRLSAAWSLNSGRFDYGYDDVGNRCGRECRPKRR